MHDAFFSVAGAAAIPGPGAAGLYLISPPPWTGPNSAVALSASVSGAAASALARLYPSMRTSIEAKVTEIAAMNGTHDGAFSFGRRIADAVFATRAGEPQSADATYVASPGRMRHRVDPLNASQGYLGVAYGRSATFAVTSFHNQNAPPTAPAAYLAALQEVRKHGGAAELNATNRTANETVIALYWAYDGASEIGTPPRLYNQIVREIARLRGNTAPQNARLFALVNCAMGDAGVHAWHWKYCFDLWRPVVGIREHDPATGPSATADPKINPPADPFWRPLGAPKTNTREPSFTPPFPAYPSGHATFGAATFETVRLFYGHSNSKTKDNIGFSFVSDELDGVARENDGSVRTRVHRKFDSVADAMFENSVSRIFLGVHWRFDGTTAENALDMLGTTDEIGGVPLGRAIATDIVGTGMKQSASPPLHPMGNCI
jgi:vanadium chloroperoxidase